MASDQQSTENPQEEMTMQQHSGSVTVPIFDSVHATLDRIAARVTPDSQHEPRHVIVRCEQAGVFAGLLHWRQGDEVTLLDARRLWYWSGAATLSELALRGTRDPEGCTFPPPVGEITLLGVCEIIPTTPAARISLASVPEWTAWTMQELAAAERAARPSPAPVADAGDGSGAAPGYGCGNGVGVGHEGEGWADGAGRGTGHGQDDATGTGAGTATGTGSAHFTGDGSND
jgi:hypothetical protein